MARASHGLPMLRVALGSTLNLGSVAWPAHHCPESGGRGCLALEYSHSKGEHIGGGAAGPVRRIAAAGDRLMFQICMFGGYDGRLRANKRVFLTMFGACELHRPTRARQLLIERSRGKTDPERRRHAAITLFGATEIKAPTLAEEFTDLQEAIRSGAMSRQDLDRFTADLGDDDSGTVFSLTLFGAFDEVGLPSEDEEVDGLALQQHLGNISDSAARVLQLGVGQSDAHRRSVVQQAIAANAAPQAMA